MLYPEIVVDRTPAPCLTMEQEEGKHRSHLLHEPVVAGVVAMVRPHCDRRGVRKLSGRSKEHGRVRNGGEACWPGEGRLARARAARARGGGQCCDGGRTLPRVSVSFVSNGVPAPPEQLDDA